MRHRDFGLLVCDPHRATPGVTLFSPLNGKATYIIGLRGDVLHQWQHPLVNGTYGYLLDNGNLLWTGRLPEGPQHMGGRGGLFREYDWNGKVLWEHKHVGQHHDFRRLPNGNTLFLGWEVVPPEIAKRIPGGLAGHQPSRRLHVWRQYFRDHAGGQDGVGVARLPRHGGREISAGLNQLRDEFAHANAILPLPNGDIYISFRRLNMIGLIDKQTKKMKWEHRDDSFGMQHDCVLLPNGNVTLFANGINTTTNPFSRVIELDPRTHKIGVGVSRQAGLHVLQPAYQRRATAAHRQHADLRGPVGAAVRGDARGRDRVGVCQPVHGAGPRRGPVERGVPRLPLSRRIRRRSEPAEVGLGRALIEIRGHTYGAIGNAQASGTRRSRSI